MPRWLQRLRDRATKRHDAATELLENVTVHRDGTIIPEPRGCCRAPLTPSEPSRFDDPYSLYQYEAAFRQMRDGALEPTIKPPQQEEA